MPNASTAPTATPPAELPAPIIIGEAFPGGEPETYVVEPGDSLFAIAEKLGVDPEEIIRLNELADPSSLEVGQVLKIPPRAPLPGELPPAPGVPAPEASPPPVGEGEDTYTVQAGDSASAIADGCGFTLDELAAANGTTIDGLRSLEVGQVLRLPGPCVAPPPPPEPEPEITEIPPEPTPEPGPPTPEILPEPTPELPPETPEISPETPEQPPQGVEPAPEAPEPAPQPELIEPTPESSP